MDNKSTLIAVCGVVGLGFGVIASAVLSGNPVDTVTIQLVVTGLIGFASGSAVAKSTN